MPQAVAFYATGRKAIRLAAFLDEALIREFFLKTLPLCFLFFDELNELG